MSIRINELPPFWPDMVAVDIETTGTDVYLDHILSVAISDGTDTYVFLHTFGFSLIKPLMEDASVLKLFQNAKFDMKFLFKKGIKVRNIYDTMIADQVIEGGKDQIKFDLANIAARRAGEYLDKGTVQEFIGHPGFNKRRLTNDQLQYMVNDVLYLHRIREEQLKLIKEAELDRVIALEFGIVPAVMETEYYGLKLDVPLWMEQMDWFQDSISRDELRLREIVGDITITAGKVHFKPYTTEEINFRSTYHMQALFAQRFDIKLTSTNQKTLETQLTKDISDDAREFITALLNIKGWNKRLGYAYHNYVHPLTGMCHPDFFQLGTRTGRFSCKDPNAQQIPRPIKGEPNMRNVWTADDESFTIIRADYSQQEPRVFAQASRDQEMLKACSSEDVYIEFAKHMYGKTVAKDSDERFIAKTFVLAVGYGAGVDKLAASSGLPREECQRIKNIIQHKFPEMAKFGKKAHHFTQTYGYMPTLLGRRRYVEPKKAFFTECVNTPIQGSAADMFKMALLNVYTALTKEKEYGNIDPSTRTWNLVHDEIEVHCKADEVEAVNKLVVSEMEKAGYAICPDVTHIAESQWAYRWDK